MTDDEIDALREKLDDQREDIRAALADECGGEPDDYRADRPATEGGE